MNYWLVSDTHFNHIKLDDWGGRTGNWQEKLWKGIAAIPAGDTLIHLGDVCIGNDTEVHAKLVDASLNISTVLVRGNHDRKSVNWYRENCFDFVCDQIGLEFHGVDILLSHRPMPPDTWRWRYNIHGHTHGNMHRAEEYTAFYDAKNYHIDISPELVGYTPLRLDTIMKRYKIYRSPIEDSINELYSFVSGGNRHS